MMHLRKDSKFSLRQVDNIDMCKTQAIGPDQMFRNLIPHLRIVLHLMIM